MTFEALDEPDLALCGSRFEDWHLRKIISGSQTSATGQPWIGQSAEACPMADGVIPDRSALQETDSGNHLIRTEQNVIDSDGTVVFSIKPVLSGGSKKTADFARKHGKPLLHLHPGIETPGQELAAFTRTNDIKVLNVAGSAGDQKRTRP